MPLECVEDGVQTPGPGVGCQDRVELHGESAARVVGFFVGRSHVRESGACGAGGQGAESARCGDRWGSSARNCAPDGCCSRVGWHARLDSNQRPPD